MKRICYLSTDHGVDGRGKERVVFASFDEQARNKHIENDKSKAWRTKKEIIIDTDKVVKQALNKLTPIDRLVLNIK